MKYIKQFVLGLLRMAFFTVCFVTAPIWLTVAIIYWSGDPALRKDFW